MAKEQALARWLNVKQTAKYLGVSSQTVYNYLKANPDFPRPRKIGLHVTRFDKSKLDEFMDKCPEYQSQTETAV